MTLLIRCIQLCFSILALSLLIVSDSKGKQHNKTIFINHIKHCYNQYYSSNTVDFILPIDIVVGVAVHESNYGKSRFAKDGLNYYGIRSLSNNPDDYMIPEDAPDVKVAKYQHYCHSTYAFIDLLTTSSYYSDAMDMIKDNPDNFNYKEVLKTINKKYSTSSNWPGRVLSIIKKLKLDQLLD